VTLQYPLNWKPMTLPGTLCGLFGDTPGWGVSKETQGVY
jgi:hypothetical protein